MVRKSSLALLLLTSICSPAAGQQWAEKMFESKSHDFGTLARHAKAEYQFIFTNLYEEDVHIRCPLPLPPLKERADLCREPDARRSRKSLPCRRSPRAYFPPTVTTSRARPRLRLRASVFRPAFVAFRARKPCLLIRLRFRGLYVGPIWSNPIHGVHSFRNELGKISTGRRGRQRPRPGSVHNSWIYRYFGGLFDFSTTPF